MGQRGGGGRCDIEGLLFGLIWLLVYAVGIAIACYIVARLVETFFPAGGSYTWVVWCIGGLILLILIVRWLTTAIPGGP